MVIFSKSQLDLRQVLIESGLVAPKQLKGIAQKEDDTKLGQMLVEQGVITAEQLATVTGQLNFPAVNLNTYLIQPDALQLIPESIAKKYNVIPLAITNDALQVAMASADNIITLEALTAWAKMRVEPVAADANEIQEAINRNYNAYGEIEEQLNGDVLALPETEVRVPTEAVTGAPVVRALNLIIDESIKSRASDIHIEPEEGRLRVRYRIDGVLHETLSLPLSARAPLISRLKILANMNIADHRPQDGQFSLKVRGREIDVRVATIATAYGEMAVLRILDKSFAALSLSELGFLPGSLEQYELLLKSPFGMILISGPTGSGKTTTLYASINSLDCKGRNVITIEDPIEYRFQDINQIQANPRAGLTFASGLRSILRLDPDVILVGEIRDRETAEIAVQSALTGHLVLASVHANDSLGSLFRLLDLGVEPFLVSSALIGSVAQRMLRRVCSHCGHPSSAPMEAQLAYGKEMDEERTEFSYGSGCNSCTHTGYLGRAATFEILSMSDEIRRLLLTGANAAEIRAQAVKEGMVSMSRDAMLKVKAGITTPCEVLRSVVSIG
ncbi:MAG TPA: ATPase, T2SS/T4P/T4SS family [Dehalococcoidales bacterium]|nr:ATPase, T2SS/T4P/T4SS family [Dehalococcoidales bacterium]